MATVKLTLTKDMLALIANIRFTKLPNMNSEKEYLNWGIDFNSIYGGSFLLEDIAYIIGRYDEHIEGTEYNAMGPEFPDELHNYMLDLHETILKNLPYIEDLVHQFSIKGGLTEGTYKCKDYARIWSRVE
jgi:hypothetical protein